MLNGVHGLFGTYFHRNSHWETDNTITLTASIGAKGVGESATVGAPPAIANAIVDALSHLGVTHIDIPITPFKVWKILKEKGIAG
jgi:carbon-monoxide dehydrogenase large subunit